MSDPQTDPTLPPHQPNTPRVWLQKLWSWGWQHTVVSAAILGALVGWIAAKVM